MMKKIGKDNVCFKMSAQNKPALEVLQNELFCLEVEDCYNGRIRGPQDLFTEEMRATLNPATGPVSISGVEPGDILRVEVVKIQTRDFAVMDIAEGTGALGNLVEGAESTIFPIKRRTLIFNQDFSFSIMPMIGVIGTAPEEEEIPNGTPGEHGGNMDCKEIMQGSIVYLPINVSGALLCSGDLHALMGDGEVCGCGAEVAGKIIMRASISSSPIPTPCVETKTHLHFIGSAHSLDDCERIVLEKAHTYLRKLGGLKANEAARMMSLIGNLQVCQVVDPLKTMKFSIPKLGHGFL